MLLFDRNLSKQRICHRSDRSSINQFSRDQFEGTRNRVW